MRSWATTCAAVLFGAVAVAANAEEPAAGRDAPSNRHVLEMALADYDAAAAMKGAGGAEAERLYRQSAERFESLIRSGVNNGRLHYNLANARLRLGELGRAIVSYRRAQRLAPGDENVRRNLEFARSLCAVRIQRPASATFVETVLFWHFNTSLRGRLNLAIACYVVFFALMLVARFLPRRPAGLAWLMRGIGVVTIIVGVSAAWGWRERDRRVEGVVVVDEAVMRKGHGEYYDPALDRPLSEGVEFRVTETRQDVEGATWYQIELADGKTGWIRWDQGQVI